MTSPVLPSPPTQQRKGGGRLYDFDLESIRLLAVGRQPYPREHGTERGYQQHREREGLPACDDCRLAHNRYEARRKAARNRARRYQNLSDPGEKLVSDGCANTRRSAPSNAAKHLEERQ